MLSIHALLSPGLVLLDPPCSDKSLLIKTLIGALAAAGRTDNPDLLFQDVMAREALSSTGLGGGCAVPHAHSDALTDTVIAVALLGKGIDFYGPDDDPIRLVFLMAGPKRHTRLHLKLLSKMARFLHDEPFREALMRVRTPEEFLDRLAKREE